jgi:hypothetical protein
VVVEHLEPGYERVLTVVDWYDGPRRGIASYRDAPHFFESEWDTEKDEYADTFLVSPVAPAVLVAALEDWEIWLRWERAFHEGRVTQASHPALPEDLPRHQELAAVLESGLRIDPNAAIRVFGEFKPIRPAAADSPRVGLVALQVRWSESHAV